MQATMEAAIEALNKLDLGIPGGLNATDVLGIAMDGFNRAAIQGDLTPFKAVVREFSGDKGHVKAIFSMRNDHGLSVLHMAAIGGSTNVINYLLKKGKIDIDMKELRGGHTALHTAIMMERDASAILLLEKGSSPNAETPRKRTPLHCAVELGNKKIIMLLISKGANVNAVADCGTPLQFAVEKNKIDVVKVLLGKHANPNALSPDLLTPLNKSIMAKLNICMKMLLKAGADPNISGSIGRTSLGWAATMEDAADIIKCLLKFGADPNITDNLGMTPLELAALVGNHQNVSVLFPVTSPLVNIPERSIEGITKYVQSDEVTEERKGQGKKHIMLSIARGADSLKRKEYFDAIQHYSEAIRYDPTDAVLFSKRSLCWACLNDGELAMKDAQVCLALRPEWPKAHLRVGVAWMLWNEFDKASKAFQNGLKLDRNNEELKSAFREALEAKKSKPVLSFGPESVDALCR